MNVSFVEIYVHLYIPLQARGFAVIFICVQSNLGLARTADCSDWTVDKLAVHW